MKRNEISEAHRAQFIPARDSRNRRVPGLYVRNGRYYAQLWVDGLGGRKTARRFPLVNDEGAPIRSLGQAREAYEIKRGERRERKLPAAGQKPMFSDLAAQYFESATTAEKRPGTLENERQAVARWNKHLGGVRIDRIEQPQIAAFVEWRLKQGVAKRTAALDLICLRNVLNAGVAHGHLADLPKFPKLKSDPAPKRALLTPAEFERLLAACSIDVTKNAVQLRDYLRFLAFSGAREQEALRIPWADVNFESERVTIGRDGLAKNHTARTVEFNPQLGALLKEMHERRAPDSSWLFPSPQRGARDEHARSFRESLVMARAKAGLDRVGFHDLRHMFASICVMAGIDFMTIAEWMGHKDGGILVGKVYGHLLDEHRHKMAARVHFGAPVVLAAAAA